MEKLLDNLNLFDIIAMLIPGIMFMFCIRIVLSNINFHTVGIFDNYRLIAVLVFGYVFGFAFQEIGYQADNILLHKICYKGKLKEMFLSECIKERIFDNEIYYLMGQAVKKDIIDKSKSNTILKCNKTCSNEKQLNRYIYNFILDYLEIHSLKDKSDKMQILAELSRSLMIISFICVVCSILNMVKYFLSVQFFTAVASFSIFLILTVVFWLLKSRYEKYRIRTMIRIYFINNLKSEGL